MSIPDKDQNMLGHDKAKATITDIDAVPLVRPESAGSYWQGVRHADLVHGLLRRLRSRGWSPGRLLAHVSRGGADLVAAFVLGDGPGRDRRDRFRPAIGVASSNERKHRLTFYGGGAAPDGAGCVLSRWTASKAYVQGFDLDAELEDALTDFEQAARSYPAAVDILARTPIDRATADRLLMEAGREGVMPGSRVFLVDEQFGTQGDAWDLLTAFGRTAQRNSPEMQMEQMFKFFGMVVAITEPEPATAS